MQEHVVEHDQRLLARRGRISGAEPCPEDTVLGQRSADLTATEIVEKEAQSFHERSWSFNAAGQDARLSNLSLPDRYFPTRYAKTICQ